MFCSFQGKPAYLVTRLALRAAVFPLIYINATQVSVHAHQGFVEACCLRITNVCRCVAARYCTIAEMGGVLLRKWIFAAAIMALPTCALAQLQSGLRSGVLSGFDHHQSRPEKLQGPRYPYSSCWRAVVTRGGVTSVWNCQPYAPP
jgi:hypothetical protein